jgi:16S rRNA C967 or C1407 C5-methylase (RsmB/RsmF family)
MGLPYATKLGETIIDLCAPGRGADARLGAAMENQEPCSPLIPSRAFCRAYDRVRRCRCWIIGLLLAQSEQERTLDLGWPTMSEDGEDAVLVDAPCSGTGSAAVKAPLALDDRQLARYAVFQSTIYLN